MNMISGNPATRISRRRTYYWCIALTNPGVQSNELSRGVTGGTQGNILSLPFFHIAWKITRRSFYCSAFVAS
uniref:Uncharacterized protein n=1 Tax=Pararge aegeria TaxID=116150 RepID=S4PQ63_9NEOP